MGAPIKTSIGSSSDFPRENGMDMGWTVYLQPHDGSDAVPLSTFRRPVDGATAADLGLSTVEGRVEPLAAVRRTAERNCTRPSGRSTRSLNR